VSIRKRALLLFVLSLSCASPAVWVNVVAAQDGQEDRDLQRAVMLFEESETAYNEGRFEEAAAMLRRAYELNPDPVLRYNLARALEGAGDLDGAIEHYEGYLEESPDASDAGAVEARVRTLRRQRDALADGDADEEDVEESDELVDEAPADEGGGVSLAPWLVAAGGAAVVGVGAIFGALSQSKANAAQDEPVQETAQSLHDQASTFATLANVFFVVGGVVAAVGVTWGVIDLASGGSDDEAESAATLRIVPGGLLAQGRF
jgi:tetratricopeptide (TPR) repeat protein